MTAQNATLFLGYDADEAIATDVSIPEFYAEQRTPESVDVRDAIENGTDFIDIVDQLQPAEGRDVAYWDTELERYVAARDHQAIINPNWEGRDPDDDSLEEPDAGPKDACWVTATRNYEAVNADVMYEPLGDALAEYDISGVFGEVREYRNGGEVHLDMFFPDYRVELALDDSKSIDDEEQPDPLILGIQSGFDFFRQTTHYSRVIALDPNTGAILRDLTKKRSRKHIKPRDQTEGRTAHDIANWWVGELDRLDNVTDTLFEVIHDASEYYFDLQSLPFNTDDFYSVLGTTEHLAREATENLPERQIDTGVFSAWDAHRALAQAITESLDAKDDGSTLRKYVRVANGILFQPPKAETRAMQEFEFLLDDDVLDALDATGRGEQQTLAGETATDRRDVLLAELRARRDTAADRVDEYKSMKARLKEMLREAERSDSDDVDDETDTDSESNQPTLGETATA